MNNRQAGRRRGRGGQRQGGNPGRADNGNRIDNRARGNAAQLLEKYKNLAQDAQRSGDRVTTEYYLQFADHYFRVLSESRSRFEENRRDRDDSDGDDEDFGMEGEAGSPAGYGQSNFDGEDQPREQRPRREREPRGERGARDEQPRENRGNRRDRDEGSEDRPRRDDRVVAREAESEDRPEPANDEPRRTRRPRRESAPISEGGLDAAVLPPAIGNDAAVSEDEAPVERPRRGRPRRVRTEDEAVPPAA